MLKAENSVPRGRFLVASGLVGVLMLVLAGRLFQLQVYGYEHYKSKADVNRIRAVTQPAPRGLIRDRRGAIMVDNYPTYGLYAIPGEIPDREQVFRSINTCTAIPTATLAANFQKYYRSPFLPVRLAKDLTFDQLSRLEEHKIELAGVVYKQFPERYYPTGSGLGHLLGYLQEVDRETQDRLVITDYEAGDLVGWSGLEKQYEQVLRGRRGVTYFQVDALGREVGTVVDADGSVPLPGQDLQTTIDLSLQIMLEKELEGYKGGGVISDPVSGEILAYVSRPAYAPDLFTGTTGEEEWRSILADPDKPLLDRLTNGLYPPGSTFKILVALGLLERNLLDPHWEATCSGVYQLGDRSFRCWREEGHGTLDLEQALVQSCNIYFYQAVQRLTVDQFAAVCQSFGFSHPTGIDLPAELNGVIPDRDYMDDRYGPRGWAQGNLLNLGLGQGEILVTPLQMLKYTNYLATRGRAPRLHLLRSSPAEPEAGPQFPPATWERIDAYLHKVISDPLGTGRSADPGIEGLRIAGKTGTAENPHGEPHAWFIAYASQEASRLSLVLLIENGGHGGEVAAPIARRILKHYFKPHGEEVAWP